MAQDVIVSSGVVSSVEITRGGTMTVLAGGVSSDSLIDLRAVEDIDPAGRSQDDTVSHGGEIVVSGVADRTTVLGSMYVESGGSATNLFDDGYVAVYGGAVDAATVSQGASLGLYAGSAINIEVLSGGSIEVGSGVTAQVEVFSGAAVTFDFVGVSAGETLVAGSAIPRAESVDGVTLAAGAALSLDSFNVASGGVVSLGGAAGGYPGTISAGAEIVGPGTLDGGITDYGELLGISMGYGDLTVGHGGVASGLALSAVELLVAPHARAAAISLDGLADVSDGAVVSGLTLGGFAYIGGYNEQSTLIDYGSAANLSLTSQGVALVESGGAATSAAVAAGATLYDDAGARVADLTVAGVAWIYGGLDSATVASGGALFLYGSARGLTVGSGGELNLEVAASGVLVEAGGAASLGSGGGIDHSRIEGALFLSIGAAESDVISGGGAETVISRGQSLSETIASGGALSVGAGGLVSADAVLSGGDLAVFSGARIAATTVSQGGALLRLDMEIASGRTSSSTLVLSTTTLSGATLQRGAATGFESVTVDTGAQLLLERGGVVDGALIDGALEGPGDLVGGSTDFGLVSGVTLTDGALQDDGLIKSIQVGGDRGAGMLTVATVASAVRLVSGEVTVGPPATFAATSAVVSGADIVGGEMTVELMGVVSGVVVGGSGALLTLSGGLASAVLVHAGGVVSGAGLLGGQVEGAVRDEGLVGNVTVVSGGVLSVLAGGSAVSVQADSGTAPRIASGGRATDLTTVAGASLTDDGVALYTGTNTLRGALSGFGDLVADGGLLALRDDGAAFAGEAVVEAGVLELATANDLGRAAIDFAPRAGATATLQITQAPASGAAFGETLLNFSGTTDRIDLAKVAYAVGASATLSGHTLTLVDGTYTATFTVGGATAAYGVTRDGHGGALIIAAPIPAAPMAQHMAAFRAAPAATAVVAPVSATGLAASIAMPVSGR